uniref:Uncharacterized protein n=1 Tax=Rhizophora mucronata TaxID=61149 RepID=A0A2P2QCT2_RHIMU
MKSGLSAYICGYCFVASFFYSIS